MYKLLIIDDEPTILAGMQRILDWEGYGFSQVVTAGSYQEALEKAIVLNPDVCLCDVCLKDRKIYELIEKFQELGCEFHYIIMSGYSDFTFAQQAIRCDAVDYLLKPVDAELLREAVEKVIVTKLGGSVRSSDKEESVDPVLGRPMEEFSSLVARILLYVAAEYGTKLSLKLLGEKFFMSSAYLGQIFQQETGMKFTDYVTAYRMTRAYGQIQNTNDKISAIATSVGYDNMSYFYTQFRERFGVSPSDLRK